MFQSYNGAVKILVILPTYNEAENIHRIMDRILGLLNPPDILVIDDNSPDHTAQIVKREFSGNPRVHVLLREKKLGLGTAYTAGFTFGLENHYSAVVTMDADFSHDPAMIPRLQAAASQYDLVIGSRYVPGGATLNWPVFRKVISWTANLMANHFLSLPPRDCTSGFRLYTADSLRLIDFASIRAQGYSYLVEILFRASRRNLKIGEIPIQFVERQQGKSKISRKEIFKAIQTMIRLRLSLRR